MHRRKFLSTAAATTGVLGGCTEISGHSEMSETEMTLGANTELRIESAETIDNNDEFVTDTDFPEDHVDPDASARIEAELFRSPERPPEIEFRLTNTGPRNNFFMAPYFPFSTLYSESQELVLIPDKKEEMDRHIGSDEPDGPSTQEGFIPDENKNGCWRSRGKPMARSLGVIRELDRDETISNRSTVLLSPDAPCPPSDTQLLSNVFSIGGIGANVTEAVVELRVTQ
jgi:hypothetical protein